MTGIINSGGNYSNIVLTTQQIFTISLWSAQRVVVYLLSLVVVDVPASPPPRSWTCPRKNPIPRHTYLLGQAPGSGVLRLCASISTFRTHQTDD